MSLTPLALQNAFAMIHKSRVPDAHRRGRLFETAVQRLVDWWLDFFEVVPHGHIRNRTFDEVEAELRVKAEARAAREAARAADRKGKGKQRARDTDSDADSDSDDENDDAEIIRSVKSLMKHALMQRGSRDMSAQLFTALCRALGVPARLVVSLQAVPWQASVGKPKPPGKKKKKAAAADGAAGGASAAPPGDVKGKGKARADGFPGDGARLDGGSIAGGSTASGTDTPARVIKLRKSRPAGQKLGSSPTPARGPRPADPLTSAPVFWTEVFSRADGRWMPVDPLRGTVNKRRAFDPAAEVVAGPGLRPKQENRMVYVVALEEDGYGKDVTPRYAKDYGAKVAKVQGAQRVGGSKARKEWWERVCAIVRRPYRLVRRALGSSGPRSRSFQAPRRRRGRRTAGEPAYRGHADHDDRVQRPSIVRA
jgi:xeroderma pigmentosum group C-complementing protein